MEVSVSAVVVSYASMKAAGAAARSLLEQSLAPQEVLIIDNGGQASDAGAQPAGIQVISPGANLGYTRAANLAADRANGEWLFFLNPDAVAAHDCLQRLAEAIDGPDVAIVGAQVLLPDGRVNAGDNPINIAGISWAGGYGKPREVGPARDVAAVSGAALLVRRERYLRIGGLCPFFVMYYDDTDLAWRVRLGAGRVRYCPSAVVVHDYDFDKGSSKWFHLEHNRTWALLSNLQLGTLALLWPVLLATEAAVLARAAREGWLVQKLRAWCALLGQAPNLRRWRAQVQAGRRAPDGRVLARFTGGMNSDLPGARLPRWVNASLELYRRCVLWLLGSPQE
jgi:GT2 family glycosyltransferase